jgi:uncharacterized iron-regulated membrane protein
MKLFKFFWSTHKWTGIVLAIVFLNIAITGFFLLQKKEYHWIQPATRNGAPGEVSAFISNQRLFAVVLAAGNPDFKTFEDIDRVDFRPGKRVHKVRSVHNDAEIQVDAITGAILSQEIRRSDWFERLHDGSFFGSWAHEWLMPVVALGLMFLVCSGLYIWYFPVWKKRRRLRMENRS